MSHIETVAKQIGGGLLADNEQWINRFQVKSRTSSSLYVIAQRRTDKTWGCSCPGWKHYRKCKHLTDVLQRLANVTVAAEYDEATRALLTSARTAFLDIEPQKNIVQPKHKGRVLDL